VAEPKELFEPGLNQTVVDWRFRDEASGTDANLYAWTNAVTPRTNDAALQEKFKQRIEEARRHKKRAKSGAGR
jgi:hypothetical protein